MISVTESLDTSSAAGRLVITIMGAVSQWEREAIGERTRDALGHKKRKGERVGNIQFGYRLATEVRLKNFRFRSAATIQRSHTCTPLSALALSRGLYGRAGTTPIP